MDVRLENVPALPASEVHATLGTSPRGLSTVEAAARLLRYGSNELPPHRRRPIAFRFLQQFIDLFAVLLIVAALLTLTAYLVQTPHDVGNLQLTVAILCVVLLNAVIGFIQRPSRSRLARSPISGWHDVWPADGGRHDLATVPAWYARPGWTPSSWSSWTR